VIQDDARQHVVWLQQFVDPQLFPNDLIADYYQSIQPIGYKSCFWLMTKLGVEPVIFAKILPIVLALITTVYLFQFTLQILPVPASGFLTTFILNQNFWFKDDISSASPRAFLYPIFAAFLYFLSRQSLIPCLITIALQGLFFPQAVLLEIAILTVRLLQWQNGKPQISSNREDYLFWLCGVAVALIVLLPFALESSKFGAIITVAQMRAMPEYGWRGRNEYFGVHPLKFIFGGSSGLRAPLLPLIIWFSIGLPLLLKSKLPLVQSITQKVEILAQVLFASLAMFLLAHLLLFKLYYPNRYTYHSLRFVMATAAGIAILILLATGWRWLHHKQQTETPLSQRELRLTRLIGLFIVISIVIPAVPVLFLNSQGWIVGEASEIYQFLASQPKNIVIASVAKEADNLPAFSQRSVLVSREVAIPFHLGYYEQLQERATAIIRSQYSSELTEAKQAIQQHGIDFFLLDRTAFDPSYLFTKDWLINSSFREVVLEASTRLKQGNIPAFAQLEDQCATVSTEAYILLDAACILNIDLVR